MPRKRKMPDGMVQRPSRKGYWCDFRAGGCRVRKFLSTNFEAACRILNQLRARADQADFGLLDNDYAIAQIQTAYSRHINQTLKPGSVERYFRSLKMILPALSAVKVSQITLESVLDYRQERLAEGTAPSTINHDVTVLNGMLNWAVRHRIIAHNPTKRLKRLRHDNPRERRPLTIDEVDRLLERSRLPWRNIWYMLLVTGLRFEELQDLKFSDLDWTNREVVVRVGAAKNHTERRIPMDDDLYAILRQLEADRRLRKPGRNSNAKIDRRIKALFTKDHVFTTTQNTPLRHRNVYRTYMASCKRAALETSTYDQDGELVEHVDIHSLRVTFATEAITSGSDPKSVQEILGHKTLEMTMQIYTKIRSATKRQAIARLRYGAGAKAPDYVVECPSTVPLTGQNGHQLVTKPKKSVGESTQSLAAQ